MHRLKQFIDSKDIKVSAFERNIGMSNGSFSNTFKKGGTIGADKLEIILKNYTELNPNWLLTGNGEMFLKEAKPISSELKNINEILMKERAEMIEIQKTMIFIQKRIINKLKQQIIELGGIPIE